MRNLSILLLLCICPAILADEPAETETQKLAQRVALLEAQLQAAMGANPATNSTVPGQFASSCADCGKPVAECQCDSACIDDCFPQWEVSGFFQLDAAYYSQDGANRQTLGDIEDGLGFRRARIAVVGDVAARTSFHLEFDFAQAQPRFVDDWMQFSKTPFGNIRIGRYRQPFGMSELTSIKEIGFLERPLTFAVAPFRQTGIMLFNSALEDQMTWFVSGYRFLSDNFGNVYAGKGGYGLATRLTFLLYSDQDRIVHFGVDYSYNDPGLDEVKYFSTNEVFVGQNPLLGANGLPVLPIANVPLFVNTGVMPTQKTSLFNLEGALAIGRLIVQSEARWARVTMTNGTANTFPGAYAQFRYSLTGERVPYKKTGGIFGRVRPDTPADIAHGQWGAWELVGRVSYLDLNGTGLPGPGRRLTNTTIGLNWYLNAHTKFQCEWIHSDLADPTLGDSNADTLALRGQIDL